MNEPTQTRELIEVLVVSDSDTGERGKAALVRLYNGQLAVVSQSPWSPFFSAHRNLVLPSGAIASDAWTRWNEEMVGLDLCEPLADLGSWPIPPLPVTFGDDESVFEDFERRLGAQPIRTKMFWRPTEGQGKLTWRMAMFELSPDRVCVMSVPGDQERLGSPAYIATAPREAMTALWQHIDSTMILHGWYLEGDSGLNSPADELEPPSPDDLYTAFNDVRFPKVLFRPMQRGYPGGIGIHLGSVPTAFSWVIGMHRLKAQEIAETEGVPVCQASDTSISVFNVHRINGTSGPVDIEVVIRALVAQMEYSNFSLKISQGDKTGGNGQSPFPRPGFSVRVFPSNVNVNSAPSRVGASYRKDFPKTFVIPDLGTFTPYLIMTKSPGLVGEVMIGETAPAPDATSIEGPLWIRGCYPLGGSVSKGVRKAKKLFRKDMNLLMMVLGTAIYRGCDGPEQ